jgi:putative peptidoglycan lipid II flippase
MLSNTDITINEAQAEAGELQAEAAALSGGDGKAPSHGGRIAKAAVVLMAGTILSRVVGVGRESSIAYLFGGGVEVGAFTIANHVATIVYDLLIAGTVSAALVPVLSEYAQREDQRAEFGKVLGTVMTIAALFLIGSVAVLEVFAEPLANFMSAGYPDEARALALVMTQWVLPGVFFMGMSGVVMASLYALNRFVYPAFTSVLFNLAIIACAFALAGALGVKALALGLVVGAIAMLVFQLPGLRDVPLRPSLDIGHPAVRKILRLYAPVGLSVVVSSIALVIDRNLASQVGGSAIGAMRYATTLVQFGLGMVAAAISLASLPSLSQHFSNRDAAAFNRTLAMGLRLVTVMVLPAAAMLLALAVPLVNLLFFHGAFTQADANLTVLALMLYVIGLPFSAIDQVLLFGFYARKNTLTPALIGVAQFGVYLAIAFATYRTWGMQGLVIANSAQLAFHALVTAFFLWRAMRTDGGLGGYGIVATALKAAGASAALGLASYATWWALSGAVPGDNLLGEVVLLGVPALVGGGVYAALVWSMRLPEVELLLSKVRARLGRGR